MARIMEPEALNPRESEATLPRLLKVPQRPVGSLFKSVEQKGALSGDRPEIRNHIGWYGFPATLIVLRRAIPDPDSVAKEIQVFGTHIHQLGTSAGNLKTEPHYGSDVGRLPMLLT